MKIAYFDCFSGAAGDMIAGAMLDAGLDFEFLKSQIATLGLKNLDITVSETRRAGLRAKHFVPLIKEEHHHRHLGDIKKIINDSKIGEKPKQTAIAIFGRLAQAEAAVHGKDPDDIHFHEVGAMDSIVDIVSAAIGFDALGIEKVYCSALAVGGGQVKAAHGIMPVPAPATAELLKGIPTVGGPIDKELLTPTGAAILTTVAESFGPIPPMTIEATGYGAGTLDSEHVPNVVRLILGRSAEESSATTDRVCLIETNIDDSTGEIIANAMDKLLSARSAGCFHNADCYEADPPRRKTDRHLPNSRHRQNGRNNLPKRDYLRRPQANRRAKQAGEGVCNGDNAVREYKNQGREVGRQGRKRQAGICGLRQSRTGA